LLFCFSFSSSILLFQMVFETTPRRPNYWTIILVVYAIALLINSITAFAGNDAGGGVGQLIDLIIFVIFMLHTQWFKVQINDNGITVDAGFLTWPFFHWLVTSQLSKQEILRVERKDRECGDIFPYFYCNPVNWCCGHKSYSGYYWPWCCVCCDATPSNKMIRIYLDDSRHRWAPCPFPCSLFWCCKYNVVSVTVEDPDAVMLECKNLGYPVTQANTNNATPLQNNTNNV